MKKQFVPLLLIVSICSVINLSAQKNTSSVQKKQSDEYLPGNSYGLGLNIPPIIFPGDPVPRELQSVEMDLGLEIAGTPTIVKELCKDYFTVKFNVRVNNFNGADEVQLMLYVEDEYTQSTNLQQGAISAPQTFFIRLSPVHESLIAVQFRMYYPYAIPNRSGEKKYPEIPYRLKAKIMGGYLPERPEHTIVRDTNRNNNQYETNLVTPLPPVCIKHNGTGNTN